MSSPGKVPVGKRALNIHISVEEYKTLRRIANARRVTMTQVVRDWLRQMSRWGLAGRGQP